MNVLFFKITLLIYFVSTVLYLLTVIRQRETAERLGFWVLTGGFVVHCITLVVRYVESGYAPLTNLHESLSFFAWALVGIFLLVELRYRMAVLGAFACSLALAAMIISGISPKEVNELNPMLDSWWLPVHVTLAFLGNAIFAVSFGAAVMYLLQERMLKSKKFTAFYHRLPSLEALDDLNYKCLSFGFPAMTMGIISGAVWAEAAWGTYWSWDPKQTWALITWFLYAALLHGRLNVGWRGRRAAILAIIAFLCLFFTYLGVNLLLPGLHNFNALEGM